MDDREKLKQEILFHESDQMHSNIQRNLSEMYKLLSIGFPVLTGIFTLLIKGNEIGIDSIDQGTTYSVFSIFMSLLIICFNNIWMQLMTFTKYKYSIVLPRLYELADHTDENYGQHASRNGVFGAMISVFFVQLVPLPLAIASAYKVSNSFPTTLLAIPAYCLLVVAVLSTFISWWIAIKRHGLKKTN